MVRRAVPDPDQVDAVLAPLGRLRRRAVALESDLGRALLAADQHVPRPTNRQIGEALGVSEAEVRRRLAALAR